MTPLSFVKYADIPSQFMRGDVIAAKLGVPCRMNDTGGQRDGMVVFIKWPDYEVALQAKDDGNVLVLDVLDWYSKRDRMSPKAADLIDILAVPNHKCFGFYAKLFPNARCVVIPHNWDERLKPCVHDKFRVGYIGHHINVPWFWKGPKILEDRGIEGAERFNCHLSLNQRNPAHRILKPATKLATASAVGAVVISYPDPSALELLGEDYPFYADERDPMKAVEFAGRQFGSPAWDHARRIMEGVRAATSPDTVATLYRTLADNAMIIRNAKNKASAPSTRPDKEGGRWRSQPMPS